MKVVHFEENFLKKAEQSGKGNLWRLILLYLKK
jgi:hypothetical protein